MKLFFEEPALNSFQTSNEYFALIRGNLECGLLLMSVFVILYLVSFLFIRLYFRAGIRRFWYNYFFEA